MEKRNIKEMHSTASIAARIKEMGAQIAKDYEGKELVLVGVLKGSFIFLADLSRAIPKHDLHVEFLGVQSYGDETTSSGVVQITFDLTKPIEGKHILVVEDIVDTGLTMDYIINNLQTRKPASVRLCSFLHKPSRMKKECQIHYLGFTIPDAFVIGYGLDYAQKYRNLPYVGVLE